MVNKLDEHARKLRRVAEAEAKREPRERRRETDPQSAEAHDELTRPEHSKGRPPAGNTDAGGRKRRGSNAGNDGP